MKDKSSQNELQEKGTHKQLNPKHKNAQKSPDTPGSPEGNTEGLGTASSEPLLPS